MTKQELIEAMEQMSQACRSFQFAYSQYEGGAPEQMDELWDLSENIVAYSEGAWREKFLSND
jgi:predicted RNA-binding protein with EMAP domain